MKINRHLVKMDDISLLQILPSYNELLAIWTSVIWTYFVFLPESNHK